MIPLNDLSRQIASLPELRTSLERVLASGRFILGTECSAFEREFADYCGVTDCVGVGNGTDALELMFRALGLSGKRVATVANAGGYTSAALTIIGAMPVFVDVELETQLVNLAALHDVVSSGGVDAIVVTQLFGLLPDMREICRLSGRFGIPVIEDCAQAHGARLSGKRAGSFGIAGCFSFYPTKNLGAIGDGGAITTNDAALAGRLRLLRQYGWTSKYRAELAGGRNSRLDELQAAVLRAKLPHLDRWNERRREIATRYSESITNPRISCPPKCGPEYVAHLYVVCCEDREAIRSHLSQWGIATDVHYPTPDHRQPKTTETVMLPVTERLAEQVLSLPCFPELTDDEIAVVIKNVNNWR